MALEVTLDGELNPTLIGGTMEKFVGDLNLQAAQNKQFILVLAPDDSPLGLNVQKVTKIRPQTEEDAFFSDTAT